MIDPGEMQKKLEFFAEKITLRAPALFSFLNMVSEKLLRQMISGTLTKQIINLHRLVCGRCGRPSGISMPMFTYLTHYECKNCGGQAFGPKGEPPTCTKCNILLFEKSDLDLNDNVSFDYLCDTCYDHRDEWTRLQKEGGAFLLCAKCHTVGFLDRSLKWVKDYRAKHKLKSTDALVTVIDERHCPRCKEWVIERPFRIDEINSMSIDPEAMDKHTISLKRSENDRNANKKRKPTKKAGSMDDLDVAPILPQDGFVIPHPGSKSFH